ncbi:hypothetical protein A2U01_0102036, partial [Trifolium medium]|nr:hypothetical protein [Trifolium medium]
MGHQHMALRPDFGNGDPTTQWFVLLLHGHR